MGGPLRAGQPAIVGERGPELIVPSGDVDVIPNVRFLAEGTTALDTFTTKRTVDKNTDALRASTDATEELTDLFKQFTVEGTSLVPAYGRSPAGGPSPSDLSKMGNFSIIQNGRTWSMPTTVGMGEGLVSGVYKKPPAPEEPPEVPVASNNINLPDISNIIKVISNIPLMVTSAVLGDPMIYSALIPMMAKSSMMKKPPMEELSSIPLHSLQSNQTVPK